MRSTAGGQPPTHTVDEDFFYGPGHNLRVRLWWGIYQDLSRAAKGEPADEIGGLIDAVAQQGRTVLYNYLAAGYEVGTFKDGTLGDAYTSDGHFRSVVLRDYSAPPPQNLKIPEPWVVRVLPGSILCQFIVSGATMGSAGLIADDLEVNMSAGFNYLLGYGLHVHRLTLDGCTFKKRRPAPWEQIEG